MRRATRRPVRRPLRAIRESSRQVWSAESGYPGDPAYRDFYRDIGFDRSEEELRPFLHPPGTRKFTGLKYHRVTGRTDGKKLYNPRGPRRWPTNTPTIFSAKRQACLRELREMNFDPVIVSPFDAELFGHWWFEGPRFLESFLRRAAREREDFSSPRRPNFWPSIRRNRSLSQILPAGASMASTVFGWRKTTRGFIRTCTPPPAA